MNNKSLQTSKPRTLLNIEARTAVYLPAGEPFCSRNGGALATWTREVYGRLSQNVSCWVVAADRGQDVRGIEVVTIPPSPFVEQMNRWTRPRELKGLLRPLKRALRNHYAARAGAVIAKRGATLIHVHNDPEAVLPLRRQNPEAIIVLHMNNDHLIEGHIATEGIGARAVAAADWVACCSEYVMQGALEKVPGLSSSKCFVIYNGADLPQRPVESASTGFKSDQGPVLLFIGRIVEVKGLHLLIDAMEEICARFPEVKLKVVGGVHFGSNHVNPYLASLQAKAAALGDVVEFVGPVPHGEITKFLDIADVFVCPSIWSEPLGMVNLEAMAASVPVVAFARGGISEAVGDVGVLVEELSKAALSSEIVSLLGNDDRRRDFARRGRERVERHFTWDVITRQWEQRLRELNVES